MSNPKRITRNIGLYHTSRELSLAGWNIIQTTPNARGPNLYASCDKNEKKLAIKVRVHGEHPLDTALGLNPERLFAPWWVIVIFARTPNIACYLLTLEEIRVRMVRDTGKISKKSEHDRHFWLPSTYYTPGSDQELIETRNAWHRLGKPNSAE